MFKFFSLILCSSLFVIGATRSEISKVITTDTIKVVKSESIVGSNKIILSDTINVLVTDTLKITKTLRDTTIIMKIDTVKIGENKKELKKIK